MTRLILTGATAQPQTITQASLLPGQMGGTVPNVVQMFWSMQQGLTKAGLPYFTSFPLAITFTLWISGRLYLHTWAPYDWKAAAVWLPADILAGKYDPYLTAQAQAIAKWQHPLWVRLMHEFNGSWEPWNAWGPDTYVKVYEYIVRLFKQNGATNVTWVWGANQVDAAATVPLAAYAVDPAFVDWTAFDAYNKSAGGPSHWRSLAEIADLSYQTISDLYPDKPMMLSEYGCSSTQGDQAAWITDALATLPTRYTKIRAALYYGISGDLALTTAAASAYAAGIKAGPYAVLGAYPMPADLEPIKPLYAASWGLPVDLQPALDRVTADLALANVGLEQAMATIQDQANEVQRLTIAANVADARYATLQGYVRGLIDAAAA